MTDQPPALVGRLLQQRAAARRERDWQTADRLRDEIRELGWEPIDEAAGSTARPRLPEAVDEGAGALHQPAGLAASLVTVVEDHPDDLERLVDGLRRHPPTIDWELLVIANAPPSGAQLEASVRDLPASLLRADARLGFADAANLGLRRTRGAVAILLDGSVEPTGELTGPLLRAFDDPTVGLAGPWGLVSQDGRHFDEVLEGEVDAVQAYCLAVRREALRSVGGFDPRFRFYRNADLDFSFAVRAAGWRAVATGPLPLVRHAHRAWESLPEEERQRLSKRNFYRFLDHWRDRTDLIGAAGSGPTAG